MVEHDKKIVELKSPTASFSVVFSHPKYVAAKDEDGIPFQLVVVQHNAKKTQVLEDFRGSTRSELFSEPKKKVGLCLLNKPGFW